MFNKVPRLQNFFTSSAQLRLKFNLLINVKMPTTTNGILTFTSRINYRLWSSKPLISIYLGYFGIYEQFKFYAQPSCFITSDMVSSCVYTRIKLPSFSSLFDRPIFLNICMSNKCLENIYMSNECCTSLICLFVWDRAHPRHCQESSEVKSRHPTILRG